MGTYRKDKSGVYRRRFGQACGRRSRKTKIKEKVYFSKREEQIKMYRSDKMKYQPYQLVRKQFSSREGTQQTKFIVRRIPIDKDKHSNLIRLGQTSLKFKYEKNEKTSTGYRIINIENLKKHIVEITTHSCLCVKAQELASQDRDPITLKTELNQNGLFSIMMAVCQGCNKKFSLETSKKQASGLYDINVRAVWGTVASGGGSTDLNEILGTMDVPPMTENMFSSIEDKIGEWWYCALKDEMGKAGAEERRIAIEKGVFHQGVPAVTVICDGGWSKRTHKHTYNAYGGVGVIFGAETHKLLYIGVRNKYCLTCRRAQNLGQKPKEHNCYQNWKNSSQSMEADIILSGFLEAESTHGVRYMKIIADGDSSVFHTLQQEVPVWGKDISKLECANHICKCVRASLERLVEEKPQYKGKGKLTKVNRIRLATAIRCAIKMRSESKNANQLRKDIINSVYHVLGFHEKCSDFCKKRPKKNVNKESDKNSNEEETDLNEDSFDSLFERQSEFWKLPSEEELEKSRYADKNNCSKTEIKELISDVQVILNKVADKSEQLIGNFTTNLAESWMSIRAKFDGGKVVNRCGRGSWYTRCYGGALRKNLGTAWSPLIFQTVTGTVAGRYFHQAARRQDQKLRASKNYKAKPESKLKRRKRKLEDAKQSSSKKAKRDYGSNLEDTPDISKERLKDFCDQFLKESVQKTKEEIEDIERKSVEQSNSLLWKKERHVRLTSSNFGKVMNRRAKNVSTSMVERLLYSKFKGNIHTIRGLTQETNTIIEYENKDSDAKVHKTGFRICSSHPFLGASTDGIVNVKSEKKQGLIEIKNFLQTNNHMIKEAAKKLPNFCLQEKNNELQLKRTHEIYYQIQGQLYIYEKDWCDFVLRRTNPYDIYIERIYRDPNLWEKEMIPKLQQFYMKFLLPELAHPRYGTYSGIRKPLAPWFDPSVKPSPPAVEVTNPKPGPSKPIKSKPYPSDDPTPGPSQLKDKDRKATGIQVHPGCSSQVSVPSRRSSRAKSVKFVGRQILHKWIVDEAKSETKWYSGIVLDVIKGVDGDPDAEYRIQYKGEDTPCDVEEVHSDYLKGWIKFVDI